MIRRWMEARRKRRRERDALVRCVALLQANEANLRSVWTQLTDLYVEAMRTAQQNEQSGEASE